MHASSLAVLVLSMAWATAVFGAAANAQVKEVRLEGQVVDVVQYVSKGTTSVESLEATMAGLQRGNPAGFLVTATKKLYVLTMKDQTKKIKDAVLPCAGTKAFVKGVTYAKGGVNVLIISDIGSTEK
jgi:hypothetical protein